MTRSSALKMQVGAAFAALAVVSFAILQVSQAAFSDTTDASGNWSAGQVALSDDDWAGATFSSTNMVPADTEQECITVTYDGNVASSVKLYGSTTFTSASDLGQYVDLTIDEVDVGAGTCATPDTSTNLFNGTLSVNAGSFTVAHTDWSNGLASAFAPATSGETQTYRVTVTLQDTNDAQGLDTTSTFTWEAQNS